MFLTALSLAVLAAPSMPLVSAPVSFREPPRPQEEGASCGHGKLKWFEGSWEELMAEAKKTKRIVFVDFWASWCGSCRLMDKTTFSDDAVVAALKDVLCFAVDKESEEAATLVDRFNVYPLPTLLFLEPDGQLRECLFDYHSPPDFLAEVERIKRNDGTITSLRRKVEAAPDDLELHYELAMRLKKARDFEGYERHMGAIRKLDPEGTSITSRRIALHRLVRNAATSGDPARLYAFLEEDAEPEFLFLAWRVIHKIEGDLMSRVRDPAKKIEHRSRWLHAGREAWSHVPKEELGMFGNNLAWGIFEARKEVRAEDLRFAVEVARQAVAVLPNDANVVDTLACCLHATGNKEEAVKLVKRCIELQPNNDGWKKRLRDFLK